MNVYVRELAASLAQAGVGTTVYVRRWDDDLPREVAVEPGFRVVHVAAGPAHLTKEQLPETVDAFTEGVLRRAAPPSGRRDPRQLLAVGRRRPPLKHQLDLPLVSTFHTLARVKAETGDPEPQRRIDAEAEVVGCSDVILANSVEEVAQLQTPLRRRPRPHRDRAAGRRARLLLARRPRRARRALGPRRPPGAPVRRAHPAAQGPAVAVGALAEPAPPRRRAGRRRRARAGPRATPSCAQVLALADRLGVRHQIRFVAAAAPPPALDLLPGRRRRAGAQPLGVVRPGRARGRGLRHPRGGRRGRRAAHPGRRRARPASSSTGATRRRSPPRSARVLDDPALAAAHGRRRRRAGPRATPGPPPRPACAGSTPTWRSRSLVDCAA